MKVPHAFQHILGTDRTPTLPYIIKSFYDFIQRWKQLGDEKFHWSDIINPGLDKLESYRQELDKTPAYTLAMGKLHILIPIIS